MGNTALADSWMSAFFGFPKWWVIKGLEPTIYIYGHDKSNRSLWKPWFVGSPFKCYNPNMKLTHDQIKKLAELARIELTEQEIKKYGEQISSILDYVKQLDEIDTTKVEEQTHLQGLNTITRPDKIDQSQKNKEIISQFPEAAGNLNKVKAVLDK